MKAEIGAEAVDAAFEDLGEPECSYQPPGGGPVVSGITLIFAQPDDEATLGETRRRVETTRVDVRVSEVAAPVRAGVFTFGVRQFRIIAQPERRDRSRLIWQCPAVEL